jgi:hypothetical protein
LYSNNSGSRGRRGRKIGYFKRHNNENWVQWHSIDYVTVAVPRSIYVITTTFKYVCLCGVSDNVYDTERKGNNNPIIHINKANNLLYL